MERCSDWHSWSGNRVNGLVFGFTTGRFSNVYFDLALGSLIVGFIVKTWQVSKYRLGSEKQ